MGRERRWHAARALPKPNPKRAISMDKFGKSVEAAICSWGIFAAMLARAFTAVSESPGTGCAAARVNHSLTSFQSGYGQHVRTGVGDRVPGLKISAQSIAILALRERVTPHDVAPPPGRPRHPRLHFLRALFGLAAGHIKGAGVIFSLSGSAWRTHRPVAAAAGSVLRARTV
jgi:hypothetical protein